ncbi:hypothetical protein PoB_004550500 [Plakobranchus ocellatus]|uniref:Uncharacterized protein n=1 Tax=Plakobranchus ocellatus TaxID=259542 RepID=A0AAV4BEJ3_9GAST|nr:hypothetical protein PoB_004550500 [Plakobranchus ocellatus]
MRRKTKEKEKGGEGRGGGGRSGERGGKGEEEMEEWEEEREEEEDEEKRRRGEGEGGIRKGGEGGKGRGRGDAGAGGARKSNQRTCNKENIIILCNLFCYMHIELKKPLKLRLLMSSKLEGFVIRRFRKKVISSLPGLVRPGRQLLAQTRTRDSKIPADL